MAELTVETRSAEETRSVGEALGYALLDAGPQMPWVIALSGELGAGKTTFVSGVLRALGVRGVVRSPTYTLVEPYENVGPERDRTAYHLDLYRLSGPSELTMLALRDMLTTGAIVLVEWAERGAGQLPDADLALNLRYHGAVEPTQERRFIEIRSASAAGHTLMSVLRDSLRSTPVQVTLDKSQLSP